jgi:hypothetical protein
MGCWREALELLPAHGCSAYIGGSGEAVELVALGSKPVGEIAGVALLFKPIADDLLAGGEPTVEAVSGASQGGLVAGDLLVQTADHGRNVGFPSLLGVLTGQFARKRRSGVWPSGIEEHQTGPSGSK